jgi:Alginate lyase
VAGVLDQNYQLGTYFDLAIQVSGGYADVFYNGARLVHQAMAEDQCYFKAGCYLQSNTILGDLPTATGRWRSPARSSRTADRRQAIFMRPGQRSGRGGRAGAAN